MDDRARGVARPRFRDVRSDACGGGAGGNDRPPSPSPVMTSGSLSRGSSAPTARLATSTAATLRLLPLTPLSQQTAAHRREHAQKKPPANRASNHAESQAGAGAGRTPDLVVPDLTMPVERGRSNQTLATPPHVGQTAKSDSHRSAVLLCLGRRVRASHGNICVVLCRQSSWDGASRSTVCRGNRRLSAACDRKMRSSGAKTESRGLLRYCCCHQAGGNRPVSHHRDRCNKTLSVSTATVQGRRSARREAPRPSIPDVLWHYSDAVTPRPQRALVLHNTAHS